MHHLSAADYKRGRLLYTFEATFEYLISILVTGSFLATLTKELGFPDSLTGIMSSIISLGCLFQLFCLCIRPKREKGFVITLSILNQILFLSLYVIPLTNLDRQLKIALFAVLICCAYILYNVTHPKKINWLMGFVENQHRGKFTANKEIISLLSGMAFSFGMGCVMDYFTNLGKSQTAFLLTAIGMFLLMLLHTFSMLFAPERQAPPLPKSRPKGRLPELLKDKNLLRITLVFVLYYVSTYISTPFYGTYQIKELGLSLKFVSAITICGSVSRIFVSKFWGRYADINSFAAMIEKCFLFLGLAQICVVFAIPSNGAIMFLLYYLLHGIGLGGVNSALINLIFDYVPTQKRADSLAITQALAGFTGFLTTLCISPLVASIQQSGNKVFYFSIYAQQFVALMSLFITVVAIFYVRKYIIKNAKQREVK